MMQADFGPAGALFSCEIVDCGTSSVSIFQEFYASIAKIFILEG